MKSNDSVVCGVDVHKKFLVAALITADGDSIFGRFVTGGVKVLTFGGIKVPTC